jgi:CBS domain-containing protein
MKSAGIPRAVDVMTTRVHTIPIDADIDSALRLLLKHGHSGAPVVDSENKPLGVLSEHDCIRVLVRAVTEGWPKGTVADHMTAQVEAVSRDDDILSISTRFAAGKHRRLLVVDDGRLVGLIGRRDLVEALVQLEKRTAKGESHSTYEVLEERHLEFD